MALHCAAAPPRCIAVFIRRNRWQPYLEAVIPANSKCLAVLSKSQARQQNCLSMSRRSRSARGAVSGAHCPAVAPLGRCTSCWRQLQLPAAPSGTTSSFFGETSAMFLPMIGTVITERPPRLCFDIFRFPEATFTVYRQKSARRRIVPRRMRKTSGNLSASQ